MSFMVFLCDCFQLVMWRELATKLTSKSQNVKPLTPPVQTILKLVRVMLICVIQHLGHNIHSCYK